MPVMIIAAAINQCGTKVIGLGSPDIFSSILFKNALLLRKTLITEITKGIPKSSPKPANKKALPSPTPNEKKAIYKLKKLQMPKTIMIAHSHMTNPSAFLFQLTYYIPLDLLFNCT